MLGTFRFEARQRYIHEFLLKGRWVMRRGFGAKKGRQLQRRKKWKKVGKYLFLILDTWQNQEENCSLLPGFIVSLEAHQIKGYTFFVSFLCILQGLKALWGRQRLSFALIQLCPDCWFVINARPIYLLLSLNKAAGHGTCNKWTGFSAAGLKLMTRAVNQYFNILVLVHISISEFQYKCFSISVYCY